MAESVSSPFLSVVPAESSGLKVAKNTDSASKSDGSDSFSRVLDDQREAGRADAKGPRSTTTEGSSGNSLPPEGKSPAETAGDSSAQSSTAENASLDGNAQDPRSATAQGVPASGDASTETELTADGLVSDASLMGAKLDSADVVLPAGQGPAADAADALKEALLTAGLAKDGVQPARAASPAEPVNPLSTMSSSSTAAGTAQLPVAEQSATGTVRFDGLEGDIALTHKPTTIAGNLSKAVSANGGASSLDSTVLNRSTADWLRGGAGSASLDQRAGNDLQLELVSELSRGPLTQRADGSSVTLAGSSTIPGMTPAVGASSTAAPAAAPTTTPLPEYALSRAPDDAEFPTELTARMKTLVRDGVREARLQLHPAELGRLQVTVTTEGDQTKVAFTAESSAARDAIEQSMPKLRELLEQSGLQLAESDVGQRDFGGASDGDGEHREGDQLAAASMTDAEDAETLALLTTGMSNSRIDTYI